MASRFSSFRPLLRTFTRSYWEGVPKGPEDPILGVTVAFQKDTNPKKINLGVGAYRDDNGKPFVLQSVQRAEKILTDQKLDHEYLPIGGLPAFTKAAAKLVFGPDSAPLSENRTVTVQTLSGTGALRVAGNFLARFLPSSTVYLPNPSWANHTPIFQDSGLKVASYPYYNPATCGLDFKGMVEGIKKAESNSVILLHACAHNPTGVDPSLEQWQELSKVIADKRHFVLFDLAYQGFASGDTNKDAEAVRLFVKDGHQVAVCQSFAKNFGLYGERIGALNFVAPSKTVAENVESQLKILIRPMYSNPPVTGARLVSTILNDAELNKLWLVEVKDMAERIIKMRSKLRDGLASRGSKRDWSHITNQIGMFCYTGISPEQVDKLASDYSVYLTRNGRISIAGITSHNVDYLAESIHGVTKGN